MSGLLFTSIRNGRPPQIIKSYPSSETTRLRRLRPQQLFREAKMAATMRAVR